VSKTPSGFPPTEEIDSIMQHLYSEELRDNPLLFVEYAFPWGQKGTPLEKFKGPRKWQREELLKIAEHIKLNKARVLKGEDPVVYKSATASGRGIGKSSLVAWITLWMMSCHYGSTTILSANTDTQLTDKTFGEIGVWLPMLINSFFFEATQKSIAPGPWYKKLLEDEMKVGCKYFYANGVLWNEDNPESFAGAHSQIGMCVIFDESSGIPENIWTVSKGFYTEKTVYRFWFAFSNPRAGAGAFYDCFHDEGSTWNTRQVNSLEVEDIDKSELMEIVKKFGEDSDEAAVEVFGRFPKQGTRQFIPRALVKQAQLRELYNYDIKGEPLILGIDPARFGDDSTVFRYRRGRDARSIPPEEYKGLDNMKIVDKVLQAIHSYNPDHIVIDSGAGAGIIDRLKELKIKCHEILFGSEAADKQYFDHRTEMWGLLRDWLPGGMIDTDRQLEADLCNPEKENVGREDKIKLESKTKMKRRGVKSPNHADALALTFSKKWARAGVHRTSRNAGAQNKKHASWTKPLL
jgi:hypothetical protein